MGNKGGSALRNLKASSRSSRSTTAPNPFDLKFTRQKHAVLNRSVKGVKGRPGASRKQSLLKRDKTLKVELESKGKVSRFIDRRIGENDPSMSLEDKMLERFMRDKTRKEKKGAFAIDEDLTHHGTSLSLMDDFTDAGLERVESDDDGALAADVVGRLHFGGFDEEQVPEDGERRKTRHEVMQEIIAKSKAHKIERQKQAQENEDLIEEVDAELEDVMSLLTSRSAAPPPPPEPTEEKDQDYDRAVKELQFERRAKASDRLMTETEAALKQKEHLEELERQRSLRMQGIDPSQPPAEETDSRYRPAQADDLGDDFMVEGEEEPQALAYKDGVLINSDIFMKPAKKSTSALGSDHESDDEEATSSGQSDDAEDSGSDGEESEDGSEEAELSQDDGADLQSDSEAASDAESDADSTTAPKKKALIESAKSELPYTFPCPTSHTELVELLSPYSAADQVTVIERIRTLYHYKIGPDNRQKSEALLVSLFRHVAYLCDEATMDLEALDALSVQIIEMGRALPGITQTWCLSRLIKMNEKLDRDLKAGRSGFPKLPDLILLKLIAGVFPTSDKEHSVVSPAMLFMTKCLSQCHLMTGAHVVAGLYLCQLTIDYQRVAKRYVPETLNFLYGLFVLLVPSFSSVRAEFPLRATHTVNITMDKSSWKAESSPLKLSWMTGKHTDVFDSPEFRISVLNSAISHMQACVRLYTDLPSFIDIFTPFHKFLSSLTQKMHKSTKERVSAGTKQIDGLLKSSQLKRKTLQLQKRKPVPIPTFAPKFQEHYSVDKRYNTPNKDLAEQQKLVATYKKERKGALRELKKDAVFVARQRIQETKAKDAAYKDKMKRVYSQLAEQEGAMRGFERTKAKKRSKF